MTYIRHTFSSIKGLVGVVLVYMALTLACFGITSCAEIYDDLEECPQGVKIRFVFDYNLEFANAFPSQVDCLSLFIFDDEGNLVGRQVETSSVLSDEDWRMTLDLPAGKYRAVAYGGLECDRASFAHTKDVEDIRTLDDLQVAIRGIHVGDEALRPGEPLHDLFHGAVDFSVTEGPDYDNVTLRMMRDTNHIRIVLQHLDNTPVNDRDFRFEIADDNTLFDHANNLLSNGAVIYTPWVTGIADVGLNGLHDDESEPSNRDPSDPVQVAFAELSVSRLMYKSDFVWNQDSGKTQLGPRLRILSLENGRTVCDLPLNNYLLLLKSEALRKMDNQEFLDRAYRYNLVFFLDKDNAWVRMSIIVDDWSVRINNVDLDS